MKLIIALSAFAFASVASAADVQITSFIYAGRATTAAELCGQVKNLTGNGIVKIEVDPQSKHPGTYRTIVEGSESFCLVVSTNTGVANVSVAGSAPALAEIQTQANDFAAFSPRPFPPKPAPKPWHCTAHRWDTTSPTYPGTPSTDRWQAERSATNACQMHETKYCNATCSQY